MSKQILLTGAAGFIGSHLAETLLGQGYRVTGLDNFDPFYAPVKGGIETLTERSGFSFVEADVARDPLPLEGVEAIIHLAAKPGVRPSLEDPGSYMEANVTATARLLDAARRRGVSRIVFGSSSSVYGNATPAPFDEDEAAVSPISPYAASKRAGELLAYAFAQLYPLRIMCLRFFTVYGPRQRPDLAIHKFTDLIARGRPVRMHGDGSSERDYTYITDCLDGIMAGLDWTGSAAPGQVEIVNIGGGARVRLDRLIALIAAALGESDRASSDPAGRCAADGRRSGHAGRVLGFQQGGDRRGYRSSSTGIRRGSPDVSQSIWSSKLTNAFSCRTITARFISSGRVVRQAELRTPITCWDSRSRSPDSGRGAGAARSRARTEPNYIEALIHRALVLNELGREEEANACCGRGR
jgi:UDP-glucuronate 4-epimerase